MRANKFEEDTLDMFGNILVVAIHAGCGSNDDRKFDLETESGGRRVAKAGIWNTCPGACTAVVGEVQVQMVDWQSALAHCLSQIVAHKTWHQKNREKEWPCPTESHSEP